MRQNLLVWRMSALLAALLGILVEPALGHQPDGPFLAYQAKQGASWEEEDRALDERLQSLKKRFGKTPNIIYILADDIGWGELGSYLGGKLRGTPTPKLDELAEQGLLLLSHYSEPSCTPTRLALLTGRYPVRTGVDVVLWPGQQQGLAPGEVTIAEVLSQAGYKTAMWGKWHVGDRPEHAPENQGFDYAYYGLYNGAIFSWANQDAFYDAETVDGVGLFYDFPGTLEEYEEQYGIEIKGILEARRGGERTEVAPITSTAMEDLERGSIEGIKRYIAENADGEQPFFIYWASYAQQLASSPREFRSLAGVDKQNNQAAQLAQHDAYVGELVATLEEHGVEETPSWFG